MKIMGSPAPAPAPVDTEQTSVPEDVGHTTWSQRVRSLLLGPHGGGTTRRRASDAVRVGIAAVLVGICVPLMQANTSVEIHVTELITPPPSGLHWLITALWFVGSIGVIVTLVLVGLLVPRLTAVRQMGVAALAALAVCLLLDALLGSSGGRPPISDFAGFNPRFPVVAAGHRHCGRTGGPALPEPSHASPCDRRRLDRRHLRGGRCLRSPARCHRRRNRGVGHGGRLPPRYGRAQRASLRGRGDRCGPRPAGRSARADLHGAPGVGRGVLRRHGHGGPAARTRGLRARRR